MMRLRVIDVKRFFAIFLTALVASKIAAGAFSFFSTTAVAMSYPAQVEDISGEKHYPAVKSALSEAG